MNLENESFLIFETEGSTMLYVHDFFGLLSSLIWLACFWCIWKDMNQVLFHQKDVSVTTNQKKRCEW